MIRNLKVLFAAALALTALGAIAVSAQGADEFHCSVSPCRGKLSTDGTGTAAHHVLVIENAAKTESVSFTCESLRGTAEFVNATDVSLGWNKATGEDREAVDNCTVNGSKGVVWHMNSCKFTFTAGATGNTKAGTEDKAEAHILCEGSDKIEETLPAPLNCVFTIGPQTLSGIGYKTIGTTPNRELTVTPNVAGIVVTADGTKANCLINPAQALTATYTTGNTLVTGQTAAGVMADAWFE